MAPVKAMKPMKGATSITKTAIADFLSEQTETKRSVCTKALGALAELASKEIKKTGKFTIPGVCMVKTRLKPATKAGKREVFGKVVMVKAKPARTVVKVFSSFGPEKVGLDCDCWLCPSRSCCGLPAI